MNDANDAPSVIHRVLLRGGMTGPGLFLGGIGALLVSLGVAAVAGTVPWRGGASLCFLSWGSSLLVAWLLFGSLRLVFRGERSSLAVAKVVLVEAFRQRGAGIAVTVLLGVIAALPLILDGEPRVHYRVQSFLTYSLSVSTLVLTLLMIFLSCETLAGEIGTRQIHMTLVKPVGRGRYLLGKWLGLVLFSAVVLLVSGVLTWALATHMVSKATTENERARSLEILSAREVLSPSLPAGFERVVDELTESEKQRDPARARELGDDGLRQVVWETEDRRWRSIEVGERETYYFEGIRPASAVEDRVYLHIRFRAALADRAIRLNLWFDGEELPLVCAVNEIQRLPLAPGLIADGRLELQVESPPERDFEGKPSIIFAQSEGLRVLYPDGLFATNMFRGLSLLWLRLSLVAALGICASTFLGFPVACLAALLITLMAAASDFTSEEADRRAPATAVQQPWSELVFDQLDQWGQRVSGVLSLYSQYSPTEELVAGHRISWARVGSGFLWLGLFWGGGLGLTAYFVFRRRELARVQV